MELIGTGKQRAGKVSRIATGSTNLTFASWEVNLTADDLPTVNFESYVALAAESYDEGLHGPLGADVSGGGDWDAGKSPLGDPPGLYPRDDLFSLKLFPNRIDGVPWIFTYARVRSASNGTDVKGKVTFKFGGKNQGTFTIPQGSV